MRQIAGSEMSRRSLYLLTLIRSFRSEAPGHPMRLPIVQGRLM
jgi:hypothetical protein